MAHGTPADRLEAVSTALSAGINYFDTAPSYGASASEANLGRTLQELGARPIVATKVALAEGDLGDITGAVARSVEDSVERLGVASIDVIQLHNRVGGQRAPAAAF